MKVLRIKYSIDKEKDANEIANQMIAYDIIPLMEPQLNERPERMTNYLRIKKVN
jgi:hypothetical protein